MVKIVEQEEKLTAWLKYIVVMANKYIGNYFLLLDTTLVFRMDPEVYIIKYTQTSTKSFWKIGYRYSDDAIIAQGNDSERNSWTIKRWIIIYHQVNILQLVLEWDLYKKDQIKNNVNQEFLDRWNLPCYKNFNIQSYPNMLSK